MCFKIGIQRSYSLGSALREIYGNFLSDQYSPEEVYARSTFLRRTRMSTEYVLRGLYPYSADAITNFNNIQQFGMLRDKLFLTSYHPSFKHKVKKFKHQKKVLLEPYKSYIKFIHKQTKVDKDKLFTLNYLYESQVILK